MFFLNTFQLTIQNRITAEYNRIIDCMQNIMSHFHYFYSTNLEVLYEVHVQVILKS